MERPERLEHILPESMRERFGGRMADTHSVGRCCGEAPIFPGLPGVARCGEKVWPQTGFKGEVPNPNFGSGYQTLYFCPACAKRMRG